MRWDRVFFRVFVMFVVYQIMGMKSDSNQWNIHGVVFGLSYPVHRCICELNIMEIGECTEAGMGNLTQFNNTHMDIPTMLYGLSITSLITKHIKQYLNYTKGLDMTLHPNNRAMWNLKQRNIS